MGELKRNRAIGGGLARQAALVLAAALVSVGLSACGGGDGDSSAGGAASSAPSSDAAPVASAGANPPSEAGAGRSADAGAGSGPSVGASSGSGAAPDTSSGTGSGNDSPPATIASAPGATTLSWTPPTINEDGSPLKLKGYRIYWGQTDDYFPYSVTLDNPGLTRYVVDRLAPATWYFTATALSDKGESAFSNVIAMQIR